MKHSRPFRLVLAALASVLILLSPAVAAQSTAAGKNPELTIHDGRFFLDGTPFQMWGIRVGSATKDQAQTDHLLAQLDDYRAHGVNAVTVFYMGCSGAAYDPFSPDGRSVDAGHQRRMEQIIRACAARDMAVIVGIFYQRAKIGLRDADAVRSAVRTVTTSLRPFRNIVINIANEQNTQPYAQIAGFFDLRVPERIIELCRLAHEADPRRIVGTGGHDKALNIAIGRSPEIDVLLFDCDSAQGTTGDYCDQFVAAGVVNKPLVNVEVFDVVTRRYERGVFPEEFKQRHAAEIDSVAARPAAGLFFHNTPWCQVEPMRYDLAGAGTKEDPGIRWYFEQVRAKTRPAINSAAPAVVREEIEWLNVWLPGNAVTQLPRVLLIGDSIAQGYYDDVARHLKDKAVVARLTTSKCAGDDSLLAEINLVLSQAKFAVIHFNNGLHGWGYTEADYAAGLPQLVAMIRQGAPEAKLVWATTTPIQIAGKGGEEARAPRAARVKPRNQIAAEIMTRQNIPIDDLFTLVAGRPKWYLPDGTHFNAEGKAAQGAQVADAILRALPAATP